MWGREEKTRTDEGKISEREEQRRRKEERMGGGGGGDKDRQREGEE